MSKCGRWGRCVLAATLCDRYRASLHVVLALLVSHPCLVSRLGCHIVWQLSAADFKHPCLKLGASTITHPCVCSRLGRCVLAATLCDRYRASLHVYERSVGFASCKAFGRSFYKASVPYPHSASSPPSTKKAGLCLFVITKCGEAGVSNRACSVGFASCETWGKHYRASLHDPHSASSPPSTKKSRAMPV